MNDIEILGATLVDLENEVDDFHFVSIGEGNLKPRFLDQIKNVNFTEFPSVSTLEVSEIVSASDLVVIPRKKIKTDTGGNVPVKCYESLAAGIPFVLTVNEEDESSKLFGDKEFAKLVSTDDKNILKSAILEMLKRTDLRELGLKGREFVVKNFDRKKQSEKLIKIIEEIGKS